jgi:DNA invertase Pin-like site-specific DNA recombinase
VNLLESGTSGKEIPIKRSKFTEEQITYALRQAKAGTPVLEVCRKLGITEQTFYRWKKEYALWRALDSARN